MSRKKPKAKRQHIESYEHRDKQLGQQPFEKKKEILSHTNYAINKNVGEYFEWGAQCN